MFTAPAPRCSSPSCISTCFTGCTMVRTKLRAHGFGPSNPVVIDTKEPQDTIPFHPYYTVKDLFGLVIFLIVFALFVFYEPNALLNSDNYIPANPSVTPTHIVPEWYLLPYYAIL